MDIKLLPKEYKQEPVAPRGFRLPTIKLDGFYRLREMVRFDRLKIKANLWLWLIIGLLGISILLFLGLVVYKALLKREKLALENQLQEEGLKRDVELEKQIRELQKGIKNLKILLDIHLYPSYLLEMLEELTLAKVQWVSFSSNLSENKISLKGKTNGYGLLAEEILVLENDPRIKKVGTPNMSLGDAGEVDFDLVLEFEPGLLKYKRE